MPAPRDRRWRRLPRPAFPVGASVLAENRRQAQKWERTSLSELRSGQVDYALDAYQAHGRIHEAPTDAKAREWLVGEWMDAHVDGEDVLMVAARLADVDDLNDRARQLLQDEGHLRP